VTAPAAGQAVRRIAVLVTPDGRLAVDRMRADTRDAIAKALADPDTQRELGLTSAAPAGPSVAPLLTPAIVKVLADLDLILVARMSGAPLSIVRTVGAWTDAEQRATAPLVERMIDKYGGALMGKYGDELALVVTLASITMTKVQAVTDAAATQTRPTVVPIRERAEPAADEPTPAAATVES